MSTTLPEKDALPMADRKPRVMLVGPLPPPSGGMANQARQLAALLRDEGVPVEFVQVNAPYRPRWVCRIPVLRALARLVPYLFTLRRAAARNDVAHILANSGWSWHLFAMPAILISRWRGLGVIVNYRGGKASEFLSRQQHLVLPVLRRANVVAVPSAFLSDVFRPYGLEVSIVPNIIDVKRFARVGADPGPPGDAPQILIARNLEPIYDIATGIRAFQTIRAALPDARLVIAGTGPERGSLASLVDELGLSANVTFTGRLEPDEMARTYAASHCMLNPSRIDNTPNSILEAWASGVPVVSTNVGGVPYLVRDGQDALLVPPGNPAAMAEAGLSLLRSPELWRRFQTAGGQRVAEYTWERVYPLWRRHYQHMAGTASGCAETGPAR